MGKFNPVADRGIPKLNPGSTEYKQWWAEQRRRCIDGWTVDGVWIPGNYYFYLNFCKIKTKDGARKTKAYPFYRDIDHEFFNLVHEAEKNGKGIIVLKARRKGFSYMSSAILLHETTFFRDTEVGIGAPTQDKSEALKTKLMEAFNDLPPEFRNKIHNDNEKLIYFATKEKAPDGNWIDGGARSSIHIRSMEDPGAMRGLSLAKMIFDEAGEFTNLEHAFTDSEACFREGSVQFGVPIIGGTSNKMTNSSEDFMNMYDNADAYKLMKFFIPAQKAYFGFFNEKTGISDEVGAKEFILKEREPLRHLEGKMAYYKHCQENPTTEEEAFYRGNSDLFDLEKINSQRAAIRTNAKLRGMVQTGNMEWTANGGVVWRPHADGKIQMIEPVVNGFNQLYVGGVDPYHKDEAEFSDSKGSLFIYKRFLPGQLSEAFVCQYTDRPSSKEEFYENCLKIAVYYNCQLLVEDNDDMFFTYFKSHTHGKNGAYLRPAVQPAGAIYFKSTSKYGIPMKEPQKRSLEAAFSSYIKDNYQNIFYLNLLDELAKYGRKVNTDAVMAAGIALLHEYDVRINQPRITEINSEPIFRAPEFYRDADGIPQRVIRRNDVQIS